MKVSEIRDLKYSVVSGRDDTEYESICFDSRKVTRGCLFICVKGANFDPHMHIEKIAGDGASGVIIENDAVPVPEGLNVYKVSSSREALALASAAYFGYPADKMKIIGITGTKGKTTTSCMIKKILEDAGEKCGLIGTLGIFVGDKYTPTVNTTPESYDIQKAFREMADAGCGYAVMEASSQAVMMHRTDGIKYDMGAFTNISNDHIGEGEHKDFEDYLNCKCRLFEQVRKAFINCDDIHFPEIMKKIGAGKHVPDIETFGESSGDNTYGNLRYVKTPEFIGLEFDAELKGEKICAEVAIPGEFNAPNAMTAICICRALGVKKEILESALRDIHVKGRMELCYSTKDLKVIVDFAHNAVSMESLLRTLREYEPERLVVVFGCGGNRSPERRYDMGRIAGEMADLSIITEDNNRMEPIEKIMADIHSTFDRTGGKYVDIPLRPDAVEYAIRNHRPGDIVAIIGKGHEDYIDKEGKRSHYTDQEAIEECLRKLSIR